MNERLDKLENAHIDLTKTVDSMAGINNKIADTLSEISGTLVDFKLFQTSERDHRDRQDKRMDMLVLSQQKGREEGEEGLNKVFKIIRKQHEDYVDDKNTQALINQSVNAHIDKDIDNARFWRKVVAIVVGTGILSVVTWLLTLR